MGALIEVEIMIDRNTKKVFTISVNDTKTASGRNVVVYVPQSEEEQKTKQKKDIVGGGFVFWHNNKILTAKEAPQYEENT